MKLKDKLVLKNPEHTESGRNLFSDCIRLISSCGFGAFTFQKLAAAIRTTEPGFYRYFENKRHLFIYITALCCNWLEFRVKFQTNNVLDPNLRLKLAISMLAAEVRHDLSTDYVDEGLLNQVISEGSKACLTKFVSEDNKFPLFQPYKDLCEVIGNFALDINPLYQFPKSLASSIITMAHFQTFFVNNLPSLTDFGNEKSEKRIIEFLENLVFSSIKK